MLQMVWQVEMFTHSTAEIWTRANMPSLMNVEYSNDKNFVSSTS